MNMINMIKGGGVCADYQLQFALKTMNMMSIGRKTIFVALACVAIVYMV